MSRIDDVINRYLLKGAKFQGLVKFFRQIITPDEGELIPKKGFALYKGIVDQNGHEYVIRDTDGYITPNTRNLALSRITDVDDIREMLDKLPESKKSIIKDMYTEARIDLGKKTIDPRILANSKLLWTPVPKLQNPIQAIRELGDWNEFTDSLVEYECEKDPRIKLINKVHLLRGFHMPLNPHAIIATTPGMSKTTFYDMVGTKYDSVTANAFLGYARSPGEINEGFIADQELPIAIDQVESQSAEDIFRYLQSAMEQGSGRVGKGATSFVVECKCPFVFLANVQPYLTGGELQSFAHLLDQIAQNAPAFLKRIAIILHGEDYSKLQPHTSDLKPWTKRLRFFRGVEETVLPQLNSIYHNNLVWSWAHNDIENYEERVNNSIQNLTDRKIKTSLREHSEGAKCRIKTAALNCVVIDKLPEIVVNNYRLRDLLTTAEEKYLPLIVNINLESIQNITDTWEENKEIMMREVYDTLPNYIKEVVSAVQQFRNIHEQQNEKVIPWDFPLRRLGQVYHCTYYPTFAHVRHAIRNIKKAISNHNAYLRRYYGFELRRREGDMIWVHLTRR